MDIKANKWTGSKPPSRILAIRLQAMGDVVITLPYLQDLRSSFPSATIDFLTRVETEDIPRKLRLFDKVFSIGGQRSTARQILHTLLLLPALLSRRYDLVIDLQNNAISNLVRKVLMPRAWTSFDRFSPMSAGERCRLTIEAAGTGSVKADHKLVFKNAGMGIKLLTRYGWKGEELVVLNPAGFFETRNWAPEKYTAFARLWLKEFPRTKFLVLGLPIIQEKAIFFKKELGDQLINLTSMTSPSEAMDILQKCKVAITEDSGLMHMAWCAGTPIIALFGSTRSDWARPQGSSTFLFHSGDLPCGNCMEATCRYGDVHCLDRYTPEQVFAKARSFTNLHVYTT